jgi:hypothetical protein
MDNGSDGVATVKNTCCILLSARTVDTDHFVLILCDVEEPLEPLPLSRVEAHIFNEAKVKPYFPKTTGPFSELTQTSERVAPCAEFPTYTPMFTSRQ